MGVYDDVVPCCCAYTGMLLFMKVYIPCAISDYGAEASVSGDASVCYSGECLRPGTLQGATGTRRT